jgi:hypothetical protein
MRRREAAKPRLAVYGEARGMIGAIDGMPAAHRASALPLSQMRNLQSKVPEDLWP